jgi:hypothetical protein
VIYHVWYEDGSYKGKFQKLNSPEEAIQMAKTFNVFNPIIQEEQSFMAQHSIKTEEQLQNMLHRQQLRYAEVKSVENRTWRDKAY